MRPIRSERSRMIDICYLCEREKKQEDDDSTVIKKPPKRDREE
jgi:hypothetical protein